MAFYTGLRKMSIIYKMFRIAPGCCGERVICVPPHLLGVHMEKLNFQDNVLGNAMDFEEVGPRGEAPGHCAKAFGGPETPT